VKIGSKERLATAFLLAVIGVIAAAVWWTYSELEDAGRQRREASEIARVLSALRLVTLEYALDHDERARAQWQALSRRADAVVAGSRFSDSAEREMLAGVRDRRAQVRQIFDEMTSISGDSRRDTPGAELKPGSEAQLLSRLFTRRHCYFFCFINNLL